MDYRYSIRLPLRHAVEVFKREQSLGRYMTRNMDVEGLFLEMPTTDLESNDVVKLIFIDPDGESCRYIMMAGVVRLCVDGAGMMLFDYEHKALDILRAADRSKTVPGRGARRAL
jgi:hypothetical protein